MRLSSQERGAGSAGGQGVVHIEESLDKVTEGDVTLVPSVSSPPISL